MTKNLTLSRRSIWAGFILSLALLVAAYFNFFHSAQELNGQLFDLTDRLSWREVKGGLLRIDAHANVENILYSKQPWSDYKLSTLIYNPRNCGLAYSYRGNNDFYFIIFDVDNSSVLWGEDQAGALTVFKKSRFDFTKKVLVELSVTGHRAELKFNHEPHSFLAANLKSGKVGLMNNAATLPPTIFTEISIEDRSGSHANREAFPPYAANDPKFKGYVFSAFLLLLALAGVLVSALRLLAGFKPRRTEILTALESLIGHPWTAYGVHLFAAIYIFWPFLSKGNILVSSSDNLGQIYPLFIYSAENCIRLLHGQALSLWNPYVHNGLPFFSNHWNMLYCPLNWPIFLLPPKWMLVGITVRSLLETFFIGVLAYKIFQKEFGANHWALFSSLAYQLCSILIFSFTIFPTATLMFSLTLYLYFLWTWESRQPHGNFFYLTVSVVLLLTSANLAFVLYGSMVLAALTIYWLSTQGKEKHFKRTFLIVAGSLTTGFLISAVRIIPCILGVVDSNRLVENYFTIHDRFAMIIRLFVPQIVGWIGKDFINALTASNLHLIFRDINLPSNSQNAFFVYFGVVAALLFLVGLLLKGTGRSVFWRNYSLATLALGLMLQPFWGVFNIVLFPFNHYSYFIIIIPLGFCAFLGYSGMFLEKQKDEIRDKLPALILLLLMVQAYVLVFVVYLFPALTAAARVFFAVMIVWYSIYLFRGRTGISKGLGATILLGLLQSLAIVMILLGSTVAFIAPIVKKKEEVLLITVPGLWCLFVITAILGYYLFLVLQKKERRWDALFVPVFVIGLAVFLSLFRGVYDWLRIASVPEKNYLIDFLFGETKFLLVAVIFLCALILYANERLSKQVLWSILFLVLAVDLVGFNARFDNVVAPDPAQRAFYPRAYPYSDIEPTVRRELDLVNYRAHYLHKTGLQANENLIYKVPTYSGIMGHMPRNFSNFIVHFGYPKETVLIYPSESTDNERFLDLCAVKYKFTDMNKFEERPQPLARMDLFSRFEIIDNDESTLSRLSDPVFDPHEVVLIRKNIVKDMPLFTGRAKSALKIDIEQQSTDTAAAVVDNPWPTEGVLLFTETYSPDWKATVDDRPATIVPANYAFMAVAVGPGVHHVRFYFRPVLFFAASAVSAAAFGLFLIFSLGLWFQGIRRS